MVQTIQAASRGPPSGGRDAPGLAFPGIKSAGGNVKDVPTVPGSYLTPSGGTGDGLGGRRTVPTASGARRASSRGGKGVKVRGALVALEWPWREYVTFCPTHACTTPTSNRAWRGGGGGWDGGGREDTSHPPHPSHHTHTWQERARRTYGERRKDEDED